MKDSVRQIKQGRRRLATTVAAGALAVAALGAGCDDDSKTETTTVPTAPATTDGKTGDTAPKSATITNPNAPDYSIEDRPGGPKTNP
jgi:hypothetical protein